MDELGQDIILLALKPDGRLRVWDRLRFALAGSELVRLVAAGQVELVDGLLVATGASASDGQAGSADPMLADALASIRGAKHPPRADAWVSGRSQHTVDAYLATLDAAGVVRTERRTLLKLTLATRWFVVDAQRQAQARARLDEVAQGDRTAPDPDSPVPHPAADGPGISLEQAALGGLVAAIGLAGELYPGPAGAAACARLAAASRADGIPGLAAHIAADATFRAIQAAADVALHAAIDAAISAADSAVHHAGGTGATVVGHH